MYIRSERWTLLVVAMVMSLLTNPVLLAAGNPIPGRWEKVIDTKAGAGITVYTKDGTGQKCKLQSIDAEFLVCNDRDGNIVRFEKATVDKIALDVKGRNIKRGFLFGLLGGAGVGTGITLEGDSDYAGAYIGYFTAFGAAAGTLIGAVAPGKKTIFISKEAALEEAKQ